MDTLLYMFIGILHIHPYTSIYIHTFIHSYAFILSGQKGRLRCADASGPFLFFWGIYMNKREKKEKEGEREKNKKAKSITETEERTAPS